ncbi:DUF3108 domain-containing protein [Oricola thermophila]|uniref:DUF3108 domain-containing protein n=1 Tax=Oricola thermophila TaxID=2742145 RepID=A0A6N1VLP4_9HYPH|nr:DUF3108 domain-containing protein [Oricola thermophila]QKV20139.1 DUF3108 domain-containing protein [Oricola thermophila]
MRMMVAATAFALSALSAFPAGAETRLYRAEYVVSALGLPVGVSKFESAITRKSYRLTGTLKARGLAALFQPTSGSLVAAGRVGGSGLAARRFTLDYVSGGSRQFTEIAFARGAVARTVNRPRVKKRGDWIEVKAAHLAGALDPISAMLVPAASPRAVCDRTISVYDGAMRADIRLSYLRTVPFSTRGYKGDAVTCRAKFLPVSGYSRSKREVAWMRDKGRIYVSFAPVEGTGFYAPVKAVVQTQIGPVRIHARRFESVAQ